jgi:hypothetical protein
MEKKKKKKNLEFNEIPWSSLEFQRVHGSSWISMGFPCNIMEFHIVPRSSTRFHGLSMEFYGFHGIPLTFHGASWSL